MTQTSDPRTSAREMGSTFRPREQALGMFWDGSPEGDSEAIIWGARVATRSFVEALVQHGTLDRLDLFAESTLVAGTSGQIARAVGARGTGCRAVRVESSLELVRSFESYRFTAWHDASAIFSPLFQLRSMMARTLYPITFSHHTISYQKLLHGWVLPLLLADTQPCDSIVCTSRAAQQAIENLVQHVMAEFNDAFGSRVRFRGRFDQIPLGVDTDLFRPREREDVRYQLGLPKDALILLSMGRLTFADKMDLLPTLRVVQQLVRDNPSEKILLLLAGRDHGGYSTAIQEFALALGIEKQVLLMTNVPAGTQHLVHAAADVFLSPSDNVQECFGLAVVEAMASGVPQVVADWSGYRDTVRHGDTGFLVPTYWAPADDDFRGEFPIASSSLDHLRLAQSVVMDPGAYRRHLQALVGNPQLRREMGRRSRERAVALYSWRSVIRQYEALWSELAEEAGTPYVAGPHAAYCTPAYYDTYRHFATAEIPDSTLLKLSDSGGAVVSGKEVLPEYPGVAYTLDAELLQKALVALKVTSRLGQGYPLGQLVQDLGEGDEASRMRRHVLWLCKYGYLEPEIHLRPE